MERSVGSSFDNKKLVVLDREQKLLAQHGLCWADVLSAESAAVAPPIRTCRDCARERLATGNVSDWEEGFCQSLILKMRTLSPKQEMILRELSDKCGVPLWVSVP